ncbi:HAD family hydrolase [Rubidibacter lacunae]|uniref:HAD family hydrolase n=1 Tax=Rubidibacter lacunae TaxID=582514 RepID=UPI00042720AE|nr:HAD family hydrolase [Rubidibacter lacunae]
MVAIRCGDRAFANIEAIVFDKDGTLEDSLSFLRELARRRARFIDAQIPGTGDPLLMACGIQDERIDPTGMMAVGSRSECKIAAAAYIAETGRSWSEALAIAEMAFVEADRTLPRTVDVSPLFPGVRATLETLHAAGVQLAILSADSPTGVAACVERHELGAYFRVLAGVESGQNSKPDPQLLLKVCRTLNVSPAMTLMVGDSAVDIEMARRAAAAGAVGIAWDGSTAECLAAADIVLARLDAIVAHTE